MFSEEFFPTPSSVIYKMLAKVSRDASNFLEPSAGKGDIAEAILHRDRDYRHAKVDCIESSPELVSVLLGKHLPVVGFDWLTYTGVCYYDAIVMNPPFSEGAEHLLRAWDFMHDGEIVCLLNEETIKNPHTAARQRLAKIIEQAGGTVDYLGDCFSRGALRSTGVNVALVYLKKLSDDDRIEMWANVSAERQPDTDVGSPDNMLAIKDELGNMQHYYDRGNEHMLKAFEHMRKAALYMEANAISADSSDYSQLVGLALRNVNSARAEFARKHRRDAWMHVFTKMQFQRWLDKKQTDEFLRDIETNGNIPFTADNVKGTLENIFLQRGRLFEQSVANVFDELTRYFNGNTNHTEGWKSNDEYKVNRKLVFPYGCTYEGKYKVLAPFSLRYGSSEINIYNDLDRILCVFDNENFDEVLTVGRTLDYRFRSAHEPGVCASRYFDIRFFKKGTVHLKWRRLDLWERFNITAAAGKKWIGRSTQQKGAA